MSIIELPDPSTAAGEKIREVLRPGEDILAAVKSNTSTNNVLIATPSRVIIVKGRGSGSTLNSVVKMSSYPYSTITSITHRRAPGIGTNYVQFNAVRGISDNDYYTPLERTVLTLAKKNNDYKPWGPSVFLYSTLSDRPVMVQRILDVITQHLPASPLNPQQKSTYQIPTAVYFKAKSLHSATSKKGKILYPRIMFLLSILLFIIFLAGTLAIAAVLCGILLFITWVWVIIYAIQRRQVGWLIALFFTGPLFGQLVVALYLLLNPKYID